MFSSQSFKPDNSREQNAHQRGSLTYKSPRFSYDIDNTIITGLVSKAIQERLGLNSGFSGACTDQVLFPVKGIFLGDQTSILGIFPYGCDGLFTRDPCVIGIQLQWEDFNLVYRIYLRLKWEH